MASCMRLLLPCNKQAHIQQLQTTHICFLTVPANQGSCYKLFVSPAQGHTKLKSRHASARAVVSREPLSSSKLTGCREKNSVPCGCGTAAPIFLQAVGKAPRSATRGCSQVPTMWMLTMRGASLCSSQGGGLLLQGQQETPLTLNPLSKGSLEQVRLIHSNLPFD